MAQTTLKNRELAQFSGYSYDEIGSIPTYEASTSRKGCGIMNVRSTLENGYWQSSGSLPHVIDIRFPQMVLIGKVSMYVDYNKDDSYTPSRAILFLGNDLNDLIYSASVKFNKHLGWIHIYSRSDSAPSLAMHVRIVVTCNHHEGLDSRIRRLNIFGSTDLTKYKI